jgi:outer membrane protein TolC
MAICKKRRRAMGKVKKLLQISVPIILCIYIFGVLGCSPTKYRQKADKTAAEIIHQKQLKALGRTEPFTIETPADTLRRRLLSGQKLPYSGPPSLGVDKLPIIKHWPEEDYPIRTETSEPPAPPWMSEEPLRLTMNNTLQVAAANNREYQTKKENVFRTALDLDLERNDFRNTFFGALESIFSSSDVGEKSIRGVENSASAKWTRKLKAGAVLTGRIFVDLVKLLTLDRSSSFGIFADATISIPLLAGSGKHIVTEPLTQAERNMVYALYAFERFKRTLAVRVASDYLAVLNQLDKLKNAEDNYRQLILSARSATRLAEAGRLSKIEVDQTYQDVLRARVSWIAAQQSYDSRLDSFKLSLGLPTDARIELDRSELERLAIMAKSALGDASSTRSLTSKLNAQRVQAADMPVEFEPPSREGGGPLELKPSEAIKIAFKHRLDLRITQGRVYDAQREVVVAADALRAGLTLTGTGQAGERRTIGTADLPGAQLRVDRGKYSAGLLFEFPWERTAEQNAYRDSYIALERAVREVQELEDQIKLQLRNTLRSLLEAREGFRIQSLAVPLASNRVKSAELFLQAGRAQVRDILEAQEALVSAQNALTAALVDYRVSELELQRDMGVIEVDHKGFWSEYKPGQTD